MAYLGLLSDVRQQGCLQLHLLPHPCIAVARVAPGAQSARPHAWEHLLHDLPKVCGGQGLHGVAVAVADILVVHVLLRQRHVLVFLQVSPDPGYGLVDLKPTAKRVQRPVVFNKKLMSVHLNLVGLYLAKQTYQ